MRTFRCSTPGYGAGFSNIDALTALAGDQNLDGRYLNRAPKASGNLGLQYRTAALPFGRLTARADLYMTEKYYFREFNTPGDAQGGLQYSEFEYGVGQHKRPLFGSFVSLTMRPTHTT